MYIAMDFIKSLVTYNYVHVLLVSCIHVHVHVHVDADNNNISFSVSIIIIGERKKHNACKTIDNATPDTYTSTG